MGERKNLFNIPAYLQVGDVRLKVVKWGISGAVVEPSPLLELSELKKADFIFPYDAYNELVIPNLKIECFPENGKLFCAFKKLSKDQEEALKYLIREHLWGRIVSIPGELMNYTQEEKIRRELLSLQWNLFLKQTLKKVLQAAVLVVGIGTALLGAKTLVEEKPTELIVSSHSEESPPEGNSLKKNNSRGVQKAATTEEKQATFEVASKIVQSQGTGETKPFPLQVSSTPKEEKLSRGENYYCVQVATATSAESLVDLAEKLKDLPYVRVEKIGRYYTLRVGFDRAYQEDEKLAQEISKRLHKRVFPRVCAYRPERWVYPQAEAR